jgi:hypothetical protein
MTLHDSDAVAALCAVIGGAKADYARANDDDVF